MTESWTLAQRFLCWYVYHGPSSCFAQWEGTYVAVRLGCSVLLAWAAAAGYHAVAIACASAIALDVLIFNTAAAFVTRGFGNIFRTMGLTMIAYISLAFAFAPIWIWLDFEDEISTGRRFVSGVYQSARTLTTAGPEGDHLASCQKLYASFQMFVGIYFLSIIVARYLSASRGAADD